MEVRAFELYCLGRSPVACSIASDAEGRAEAVDGRIHRTAAAYDLCDFSMAGIWRPPRPVRLRVDSEFF